MKIIEQFTCAKSTTTPSEDLVVVTDFYAAVIDGATAKSAALIGGETPGHLAAAIIARAIRDFRADLTASEAISLLTEALTTAVPPSTTRQDRPTASVVIYSAARREVWQVGDCPFAVQGCERRNAKAIDRILASWRARLLRSLLAQGCDTDDLRRDDPGRRLIQPYITAQVHLQNGDPRHRHTFGVLDGTPVPAAFIKIHPIAPGADRLILGSDGYPCLLPTLEASEGYLQRLLLVDPLCIGPLLGTKCVGCGQTSFDDRTYLSLTLNDPSL